MEYAEPGKPLRAEEHRKAELATARKTAREVEAAAREAAIRPDCKAIDAKRTREVVQVPIERGTRSAATQVKKLNSWLIFRFLIAKASQGMSQRSHTS
jgi:hypothetical protein